MKILKNRKALSPVVASIILIAVTVAVSIAVAAWMGALTFNFMGTEQAKITHVTWTTNTAFSIDVNNTGTKDMTIQQILVNYVSVPTANISPALPLTLKAATSATITVTFAYTNGTNYDISVASASGYKFTNTFTGGTNAYG
jgi:flagellin-like protein